METAHFLAHSLTASVKLASVQLQYYQRFGIKRMKTVDCGAERI